MSNSLQPHGLQHARLPCPSLTGKLELRKLQLPEFTQTHVHWVGDDIQPSHPVIPFSSCLQSSQHQCLFKWVSYSVSFQMSQLFSVFSNESALRIRWPKYWSFSFNISPSNEYSVLISFRMDWFDILAVQGTRMSLLQHHSSKISILRHSTFVMVQLSHP